MPADLRDDRVDPGLGRGIVVGAALGLSAGLTGALVGYAWMTATGADMGLWVVARASGLISYLLLTAVAIAGLVLASPPKSAARFIGVAQRLRIHVLLAIFALVFIVLHIVVLAIDPWAEVGWWGALVPFGSAYRPLPVTLGLLALWSGLISGVTAGLAGRGLGRMWLPLHRLAAAGWVLAWLHGVLAGSDTPAWMWMYVVTGVAVLALVLRRVMMRTPKDQLDELREERMPREEVLA
jgi:predicted ferric reductase